MFLNLYCLSELMGWQTLLTGDDLAIFQRSTRGYSIRIEVRRGDEHWTVYHTYFNDHGLNLTEEYDATTREDALKVAMLLQKKRLPSIHTLKERMLRDHKKIQIHIHRSYKEYNVEKWHFSVGKGKPINFAVVRFDDHIEMDFIIHADYRKYEKIIIQTLIHALGVDSDDDDLVMRCYYFVSSTIDDTQQVTSSIVVSKIGMDSDD